ncbi:hypothetical protein CY34DRAFT_711232 [Suillus luteus UH-Slu-Lm8-n1]|uniref:Uncharacterized protein n=1 Tax=Suillus luteus UH-Slu-Lm8-n1 TaxID=930992 RepID=A0A0C9ZVN7_9AGAM|nr:hypothetical protein CY34DRAFT_711232 [Suillus luteus UH-Slu-Lm8-n1]
MALISPIHGQSILRPFLSYLKSFSVAAPSGWIALMYLEHVHFMNQESMRHVHYLLTPEMPFRRRATSLL